MPAKLTTEEFIRNAISVHGNKYDYSKSKYINNFTKIQIICPYHGEFLQRPNHHVSKKCNCPKCCPDIKSLKTRYTQKQFIKKATSVHGNKYDYSKVNYKGCFSKVVIICPKHGEFLQTTTDHTSSNAGCPECAGLKKYTTESFIKKAKIIHGDKYNYDKVVCKNNRCKVIITCFKHGDFLQSPREHAINKQGCPNCIASHGELTIIKILNDKKIKYIRQKTFNNCINPKTKFKLKYDFYLPKQNLLIEYNGIQHYYIRNFWKQNEETLFNQQYRDQIKEQYALSNNYRFLVIKYTDNIESVLLRHIHSF